MPYVFQFFVHHELRFEENLHGLRCGAHNKDGDRCSRKTVIGRGLCWQHLLKEKHLRIRPSTIHGAGRGLFCIDPSKPHGALIYREGEKIVQYEGHVITRQQLDDKYGHENFITAPYAFGLNHGLVEDAAMYRSPAALINHKAYNQANCRFSIQRNNRCAIVAKKNIRNGDELFASYGDAYDLHPHDTAYRTIYKT